MLTIRVTPYWGDLGTLKEVLIIGPYNTAAEREVACDRLNRLGFKDGDATFELSGLHRLQLTVRAPQLRLRRVPLSRI